MKWSNGTHIPSQSSLPTSNRRLGLQMLIVLAMMFLTMEAGAQSYVFERLWPQLPQPWYYSVPQKLDSRLRCKIAAVTWGKCITRQWNGYEAD
jgi:hypothetical protein